MTLQNEPTIHLLSLFVLAVFLSLTFHATSECQGSEYNDILANNWNISAPTHITGEYHIVKWSNDSYPEPRRYYRDSTYVGVGEPWQVATGDVNQDGFLDLAYFDDDGYLRVIDGSTGGMIWSSSGRIRQQYPLIRTSPVMLDYDSDGDMEVLFSEEGGWMNIVEGDSGKTVRRLFVGTISTTTKLMDVDGDGSRDLLIGLMASDPNPTLICLSGRTLSTLWTYRGPFQMARSPAVADINSDGLVEIVLTGGEIRGGGMPYYSYWPSDWIVTISATTGRELWNFSLPGNVTGLPTLVDIDSDGDMEILVPCDCGLMVLDSTGNIVDQHSEPVDGYFTAGDWDGDGDLEVFIRTFDYVSELGFILYDDSDATYLVSPDDTHSVSVYSLIDLDSDGELEIIYDSYEEDGSYSIYYIDSRTSDPVLLMENTRFVLGEDLDGDGLAELLVYTSEGLELLDENDPNISVAMEGLAEGGIAYPESLNYSLLVTIEFSSSNFSIQRVKIDVHDNSSRTSIEFYEGSMTGQLLDSLNDSLTLLETDIWTPSEGHGFVYSSKLRFKWHFPITKPAYVSVYLQYNRGVLISEERSIEFRVEKGLELMGSPVLTTLDVDPPGNGLWFANEQDIILTGLTVIHEGSIDLRAPRYAFGILIGTMDEILITRPRGETRSLINVTFQVLIESGTVHSFNARIGLVDLVPGAVSTSSVEFEFRVDAQLPTLHSPNPPSGMWQNKSSLVCSIYVDDRNGSGLHQGGVEWRLLHNQTAPVWHNAGLNDEGGSIWRAFAVVQLNEDGEFVLEWKAMDVVGNIAEPFKVEIGRDTVPPEITIDPTEDWYNRTQASIRARIVDETSGILDNRILYRLGEDKSEPTEWRPQGLSADKMMDITVTVDQSGHYILAISATDIAGNRRVSTTVIHVDLDAPEIVPDIPWILNITDGIASFEVHLIDPGGSGFGGTVISYWLEGTSTLWDPLVHLQQGVDLTVQVDVPCTKDTNVRFRAQDRAGNPCVTDVSYLLNINNPPHARITRPMNDAEFRPGGVILIDGSKSSDPEDQALTFRWILDGKELAIDSDSAEVKASSGNHHLVLIVSDGFNTNQSKAVDFTVHEIPSINESLNLLTILVVVVIVSLVTFRYLKKQSID